MVLWFLLDVVDSSVYLVIYGVFNCCSSDMEDPQPLINDNLVIPDWLKNYESTFLWHTQEQRGLGLDFVIVRTQEKLEDLKLDEPGFSVQRYVCLLKLVIEFYIVGEIKKSWEIMKEVESLSEKEESEDDPLYENVKLSLDHVISSTKACLLFLDNQEDKARKLLSNVIPINLMADHEVAAINAMRARFYLYAGYENGEDLGVRYARKALQLEPENAEWEYLLAKMLRQQRREVPFSTEIPKEEILLLESAVKKSKCSKYLMYLAQVYREANNQAFKCYRDKPRFFSSEFFSTIEDMGVKALNLYKETLELDSDSPAVLRRVGYGVMNLPKKIADYDLAEKCLLKSLSISSNQMTLHVLGTFYHRFRNDNQKALEYFEKTAKLGSLAGVSDMIRIKYILDSSYDPCPDFNEGLKWQIKKKNKHHLLTQKGGYFLFIKRDFIESKKYFYQVISEDENAPCLKKFKCIFLRMNNTINLYEYLVNEALLFLNRDSSLSQDNSKSNEDDLNTAEKIGDIEEFLTVVGNIHPELVNITPDASLIDMLIGTSNEIKEKDQTQKRNFSRDFRNNNPRGFRGHQRGNRRPFSRGRGNYHSREGAGNSENPSTDDNYERRGRFSTSNQRNTFQNNDDVRKNRFHNTDLSNENQHEKLEGNWRQATHPRGRGHTRGNFQKNPSSEHKNWRDK